MHATPALVDRVWYFVVEMLSPAAASAAARRALQTHLASLPWHRVTCHIHDEQFVPALLQQLPVMPEACHAIFAKLDWLAYLTALVSAADGAPQPALSALLRLVLELHATAPACLSSAVRLAIFGEGPTQVRCLPPLPPFF